jgi:hypothetical protein
MGFKPRLQPALRSKSERGRKQLAPQPLEKAQNAEGNGAPSAEARASPARLGLDEDGDQGQWAQLALVSICSSAATGFKARLEPALRTDQPERGRKFGQFLMPNLLKRRPACQNCTRVGPGQGSDAERDRAPAGRGSSPKPVRPRTKAYLESDAIPENLPQRLEKAQNRLGIGAAYRAVRNRECSRL